MEHEINGSTPLPRLREELSRCRSEAEAAAECASAQRANGHDASAAEWDTVAVAVSGEADRIQALIATLVLYDALHDKTYVHKGVSGRLAHGYAPFGPARGVLMHHPDAEGMDTDAYAEQTSAIGARHGTWSTDLTHAEALGEVSIAAIARELGVSP